ncbi:MAG: TonB-dependent receptor plug domain-containing protein [Arcicella sp.]|nr:TonB-dependent receptor plug domain-containing protein [Arcicella sp.]
MKKIYIILIPIFLSNISQAQTNHKELDEVIVKEKKKTERERSEFIHHAQSIKVLTETDLNRNNPAFIEQSLNIIAGVQMDKRTQLGGQRLIIRGYGNDQKFNSWGIKAYYNGVPITSAEGITVMDDIDFANLDHVDVIKGPAATLYGGGVGGVARFYMKPSEEKGISVTEKFAVGSFGLFQSNTRIDYVTDSSSMMLNYGHLQSDGYRPLGSSLKNFVSFLGELKLSRKQTLTTFLSHNYSLEGITGQIPYADYYAGIDKGNLAYTKKNSRNDFQTTRFNLTNSYTFSKNFTNTTSLFFFLQDFKRVVAGADENSMSPSYGIRSVFDWKTNFSSSINNNLTFGTEIQQSRSLISNFRFLGTDDTSPLKLQDISRGSYFKNITNQASYFFINRTTITPYDLSLIVGLSANNIGYSRADLFGGPGLVTGYNRDLSFEKTFSTSFNPHVALQKVFGKQIVNLSYSEGYNAPTATSAFIGTINKANDDLLPEKAKMIDLAVQGLLFDTKLDYQISYFGMDITNKLTQLSGVLANGGTYTYFANTGNQKNNGLELSLAYTYVGTTKSFLKKVQPFLSYSNYDFTYSDFKTRFGGALVDYSGKRAVGLPNQKYALGLDILTNCGLYLNNTYTMIDDVYTDFANTNNVKGFTQLNSKIGYLLKTKRMEFDFYVAGNNLTYQINYTFLFLGNSFGDTDPGNGFSAGAITDVNPGPSKAYYFGGVNVKFRF